MKKIIINVNCRKVESECEHHFFSNYASPFANKNFANDKLRKKKRKEKELQKIKCYQILT